MPRVTLLQSNRRTGAALVQALSSAHEVTTVRRWWALLANLERRRPHVCIVDLDYQARPIDVRDLERLRASHPTLALVAFGDFHGREMELFQIGRAGIDEVILAGRDQGGSELREAVGRALNHALARRLASRLGDRLPELGFRCLSWSVQHAHLEPGVGELAEAFLVSRRTLSRRLRSRGLLTPSQLLVWGRLFRATWLLEETELTLEAIAYRMGYSSGAALRRAMKREAGASPTTTLRRGGLEWMIDAFVARLARRSRQTESHHRQGESCRRQDKPGRWTRSRADHAPVEPVLGPYG